MITEKIAAAFPRPVRLWLYGIGVATFGVLIVYAVVNLEQAAAWLLLVGSVLGLSETGMAALNARRPDVEQTAKTLFEHLNPHGELWDDVADWRKDGFRRAAVAAADAKPPATP